jgi:hypothetical protein
VPVQNKVRANEAASLSGCGNLPKEFLKKRLNAPFQQVLFWEKRGWEGYPLPPPPSESRDWRGVYKDGLQNLEPLEVRGQNLDNKELTSFFATAAYTAHALLMICFLFVERKGRCHKGAVEKSEASVRPFRPTFGLR